jgi:hypothetical protein
VTSTTKGWAESSIIFDNGASIAFSAKSYSARFAAVRRSVDRTMTSETNRLRADGVVRIFAESAK